MRCNEATVWTLLGRDWRSLHALKGHFRQEEVDLFSFALRILKQDMVDAVERLGLLMD